MRERSYVNSVAFSTHQSSRSDRKGIRDAASVYAVLKDVGISFTVERLIANYFGRVDVYIPYRSDQKSLFILLLKLNSL